MPIINGPSPFDSTGAQFAWDSTSLSLAETCLRKYYYKMLCGWQPARKSAHLIFGGLYASALEHFHKAIADGVPREQATRDVVHEALIDTWEYEVDEAGDPIEGSGTPWESDHNLKTRGNLIRTIIWYLDHFENDACSTIILSDGTAAVEHSFKLPVDNSIILSGHLDRLVEYSHDPYIQDQKTTGATISSHYFDTWNPSMQMSMYTFAGKAIFNLPVKGVMIDAAQIAVGFSRFVRGFTFRDDGALNEWYDNTMTLIERTRATTVEQSFPMNSSACGNYGGCEFRHICSRSPSVRENFLRGDFVQGPIWNPLENR